MAWSSFFAGVAGAGIALGVLLQFPRGVTVQGAVLALALGYLVGAGIGLALPGRDSLAWKDFWVSMAFAVIPGAVLVGLGVATNSFRGKEFAAVAIGYPLVGFLVTRGILELTRPFDPWLDDNVAPFRAQPIISLTPSGAMVGLAATW